MKYQKQIILALAILFTSAAQAADTFYETLKKHGDVRYSYFYHVYKDGSTDKRATRKNYTYRIDIKDVEGVYSGIYTYKTSRDKGSEEQFADNIDGSKQKIRNIGYPHTRMLYHESSNSGYVAIGNYVFELEGVNEDKTDFKQIKYLYIANIGSDGKKIKGINLKTALKSDLYKMVRDYLAEMKGISDAYTLTEKDEASLELIEYARAEYKNRGNAEWKAHQEEKARLKALLGESGGDEVILKNTSSSTIFIADEGSRNKGTTIQSGMTTKWPCDRDAYFQTSTYNGSQTIYETTGLKAYTAGSGCGETIEIQ